MFSDCHDLTVFPTNKMQYAGQLENIASHCHKVVKPLIITSLKSFITWHMVHFKNYILSRKKRATNSNTNFDLPSGRLSKSNSDEV